MTRVVDVFCKAFEYLIGLMLGLMVLLVFGNVVLRYGFNSGIAESEELSRWLFIWITFLGATVALRERAHLGVDMLVSRLPTALKKACLAASYLIMLYIVWLLAQGSAAQIRINWDAQAPVTGASMAFVYAAGMVFAVCAGMILLTDLGRLIAGRVSADELVGIQGSEEAGTLAEVLGSVAAGGAADPDPRSRTPHLPRNVP